MSLADLYRDLHQHPELGFAETRTAAIAARELRAAGFDTTEGVGRTGVVGVLRNGDGPAVMLRADMDALPMAERTGLPYASTTVVDRDGEAVPVAHACGHDVHVTCLVGAVRELAATREAWRGTVIAVFQPAEEAGGGAQGMVDDGLFDRFDKPDVVLGQHVAPIPAGFVGLRPGAAFAASDTLRVTLYGEGGHGARPEASVDPVVMAAATVLRLQTIVSREIAAGETAVLTVGAIRAGTVANIIPDEAELLLSVRSYSPVVRERVLTAVERIVRAEAAASGAPREPEIVAVSRYPAVVNDPDAVERVRAGLAGVVTGQRVVDPGPVTGSEDVGVFATAAGVPLVYWLLGGADPAAFADATTMDELRAVVGGLPANHSPLFAPVISPTLEVGVAALVAGARAWLT
ncbi:hippurate hydrolase [Saccharothrix tamanrassetensis]|uniref:Hippurate hydrolase n=1 Tax=Saccharothrix tamanrassetensis TaxID=1051531 RepID=A0A841CKT6_9PSEU|nr:amidohydrolase [Saccharothrix tamanrassetensis]MBB5958141.1 hippurate hydrolase [Saccharothrix tamanrassetensis]